MDPYIGEIRIFAGSYAPSGWAFCQGQLMPIVQNTALFSIIGTYYGGDGKTTFALPNLQSRAPMHQGAGPGLTARTISETDGVNTVTLLESQIPAHNHVPNCQSDDNETSPVGGVWASTGARGKKLYATTPDTPMNPQAIGVTGGSQPHNNMQPYLAMNYIIALEGVFPPKP